MQELYPQLRMARDGAGDKPVGHLLTALIAATNAATGSSGLTSFVYQLAAEPALPQLQQLLTGSSATGAARHVPLSANAAIAPGGQGALAVERTVADDECDVVVDMLGWSMELQATIARRAHRAPLTISILA